MKKGVLERKKVSVYQNLIKKIKQEFSKTVVGQENIINGVLKALFSDGHIILEGVPGIAKTLIMRTLAAVTSCTTKRIQFTADLLPTDIIGLTVYTKKGFQIMKGPLFSNFILADEINRAPPKVQSALLEAMQEKQVTIGKQTYNLELPFLVIATENPIETLGVYPLPEAQVDRFLFKLNISYPSTEEEQKILKQNITLKKFENYNIKAIVTPNQVKQIQKDVKKIYLSKALEKYIIKLVNATRDPMKYNIKLGKYIAWGASPRASIGMYIGAKADALLEGKNYVIPQNIKNIAYDILRHRLILTYEGQAENIKVEDIITEILKKVKVP